MAMILNFLFQIFHHIWNSNVLFFSFLMILFKYDTYVEKKDNLNFFWISSIDNIQQRKVQEIWSQFSVKKTYLILKELYPLIMTRKSTNFGFKSVKKRFYVNFIIMKKCSALPRGRQCYEVQHLLGIELHCKLNKNRKF